MLGFGFLNIPKMLGVSNAEAWMSAASAGNDPAIEVGVQNQDGVSPVLIARAESGQRFSLDPTQLSRAARYAERLSIENHGGRIQVSMSFGEMLI